jgi:hypothetical protein
MAPVIILKNFFSERGIFHEIQFYPRYEYSQDA